MNSSSVYEANHVNIGTVYRSSLSAFSGRLLRSVGPKLPTSATHCQSASPGPQTAHLPSPVLTSITSPVSSGAGRSGTTGAGIRGSPRHLPRRRSQPGAEARRGQAAGDRHAAAAIAQPAAPAAAAEAARPTTGLIRISHALCLVDL